jgi:hypothetical protein
MRIRSTQFHFFILRAVLFTKRPSSGEQVMSHQFPYRCLQRAALLALALAFAGCSGQSSVESFHPKGDVAKEALEAALTAWQDGQPKPGLIEDYDPPVQVQDDAWSAGSKLKSFEIVEALPGDSPRKFAVKLTIEGEAAPVEITYVVVGKNPLHVMREKEYNRDNAM